MKKGILKYCFIFMNKNFILNHTIQTGMHIQYRNEKNKERHLHDTCG